MTKTTTREVERKNWEKRTDLSIAYGLITGLIEGLSFAPETNKQGFIETLKKVQEILKKQSFIK